MPNAFRCNLRATAEFHRSIPWASFKGEADGLGRLFDRLLPNHIKAAYMPKGAFKPIWLREF